MVGGDTGQALETLHVGAFLASATPQHTTVRMRLLKHSQVTKRVQAARHKLMEDQDRQQHGDVFYQISAESKGEQKMSKVEEVRFARSGYQSSIRSISSDRWGGIHSLEETTSTGVSC